MVVQCTVSKYRNQKQRLQQIVWKKENKEVQIQRLANLTATRRGVTILEHRQKQKTKQNKKKNKKKKKKNVPEYSCKEENEQ